MGWLQDLLSGYTESLVAQKFGPDFRLKQAAAASDLENDVARRGLLGVQTRAGEAGIESERLKQKQAEAQMAEEEQTRAELARLAGSGVIPSASKDASDLVSTLEGRKASARNANASAAQTENETGAPEEYKAQRRAILERALADAQESRAKAATAGEALTKGILIPVTDNQGRVTGFYNNRSGEVRGLDGQPMQGGFRKNALPATENAAQAGLSTVLTDLDTLEDIAKRSGSIGFVRGRLNKLARATGLQADTPETHDTNDLFHISENLADQLLRARSGAQINEKEFVRLRDLVPDATKGRQKFFDDLRRMRTETQNILASRKGEQPAAPAPGTGGGLDPEVERRLKGLGL